MGRGIGKTTASHQKQREPKRGSESCRTKEKVGNSDAFSGESIFHQQNEVEFSPDTQERQNSWPTAWATGNAEVPADATRAARRMPAPARAAA